MVFDLELIKEIYGKAFGFDACLDFYDNRDVVLEINGHPIIKFKRRAALKSKAFKEMLALLKRINEQRTRAYDYISSFLTPKKTETQKHEIIKTKNSSQKIEEKKAPEIINLDLRNCFRKKVQIAFKNMEDDANALKIPNSTNVGNNFRFIKSFSYVTKRNDCPH